MVALIQQRRLRTPGSFAVPNDASQLQRYACGLQESGFVFWLFFAMGGHGSFPNPQESRSPAVRAPVAAGLSRDQSPPVSPKLPRFLLWFQPGGRTSGGLIPLRSWPSVE